MNPDIRFPIEIVCFDKRGTDLRVRKILGDWIDSFIRKSVKSSFASPDLPSFRQQCEKKDNILFEPIRSNRNHVLAGLLPPVKETGYDLRTRAHDFVLPCAKSNKLVDKNFLHRVLFKNMY